MFEDTKVGYRVKIILRKDDGYMIHEIRRMATNIMSVISESGLKIFYNTSRDNINYDHISIIEFIMIYFQ